MQPLAIAVMGSGQANHHLARSLIASSAKEAQSQTPEVIAEYTLTNAIDHLFYWWPRTLLTYPPERGYLSERVLVWRSN
jgi:hypothetical protein